MLAESHEVGSVPVLVPVTLTAMYLPACVEVRSSESVVPLVVVHVSGTVCVADVTSVVHAYH